jgi:hypothetical protein
VPNTGARLKKKKKERETRNIILEPRCGKKFDE